ncbi:Phakinin [Anabarilius grahami]|uniref:Phakinin n=1 Tax=Anabarilius grahami TaxID=495550 RepID=A0A3N0YFK5_ANAGA|nr:Phakinin [Anabarilius grahami]
MPLPRRRSSFLGQAAAERPGGAGRMSGAGTSAPRGVFVGMAPTGGTSSLGARVSRRALGMSSVFLQSFRSNTFPVVAQPGDRGHQHSFESLNTCLLEYRDKVHALEQLNRQLEEQIRHCLERKAVSAGTWTGLKQDWEDVYLQDVRVLYKQISGREVDEPDAPTETSLDQILAFIRSHWEKVIEKNRAETDAYLECKQADSVNSKLSREEEELESLKTECNDAGCKIQSLQAETESIRALKRGLENALKDAKHWHDIELQNLGSVIGKLEAELTDVRGDIEQQRQDYETLLNNRKKLELEIGTYHGILDGEESRFYSSMFPGGSSVPEGRIDPTSSTSEPQSCPEMEGSNAPGAPEEGKNE